MSDGSSRIIELGICDDNKDPLGLGRIRLKSFSGGSGPAAGAFNYEKWSDKDPFIALPFLPYNINYIPKIGQAIKVINFDTQKDIVNREYVSGPFTTIHDFNTQVFSSQTKHTTYGGADSSLPVIVNKESGEVLDNFVKGSVAKDQDYAIYGKNGSDIILTENGLVVRGGKFLPKNILNKIQTQNTYNKPYMSSNVATLTLKKFDEHREFFEEVVTDKIVESKQLKSIIEYSIDKFDGSDVVVNFYVYLLKNLDGTTVNAYGNVYRTDNPNLSSVPLYTGTTQLITSGTTQPTFSVSINSLTSTSTKRVARVIRKTLKKIHMNGTLRHVDNTIRFPDEPLHPFFFRPTTGTTNTKLTTQTEINNRTEILNNIILAEGVGPKTGLVYDMSRMTPTVKTVSRTEKKVKITPIKEQTFGSIKSDNIYFISPSAVPPEGLQSIDFTKLDSYELTHSNYLDDIQPKTYSVVRGETLVKIIEGIVQLIFSHQHNLIGPPVPTDPNYVKLVNLMKTLERDILNKSIRIN